MTIRDEEWERLEVEAVDQLDLMKGKSPKAFFFLGISLYKMQFYDQACLAFQRSSELKADDAQVQYNLGLAYFKEEKYSLAVEHLKICTQIDATHPYAYNNLAFIYNMHKYYSETINVCNTAKNHDPDGWASLNCLRHWAFALFKKGEMAKAIKKIKSAI